MDTANRKEGEILSKVLALFSKLNYRLIAPWNYRAIHYSSTGLDVCSAFKHRGYGNPH
jgi:hypothetical protein